MITSLSHCVPTNDTMAWLQSFPYLFYNKGSEWEGKMRNHYQNWKCKSLWPSDLYGFLFSVLLLICKYFSPKINNSFSYWWKFLSQILTFFHCLAKIPKDTRIKIVNMVETNPVQKKHRILEIILKFQSIRNVQISQSLKAAIWDGTETNEDSNNWAKENM